MTYDLSPEELGAFQRSKRNRSTLDILVYYVCLTAHLHGLEGNYVQNGAIGREEKVETPLEVGLVDFVVQAGYVKPVHISR